MALEEYRDPLLQKLIDKLEEEGPEALKGHYRQGDVLAPPKEELPIVSVARQDTIIKGDGTMQDVHVTAIEMTIIIDWTSELNQSFDLARGTTQLYELMEKRGEDLSIMEGCLSYVLRDRQKLADNLFISINDDGLRLAYGLGWEKRGDNIFSAEGILRFNLELTQPKPNLY